MSSRSAKSILKKPSFRMPSAVSTNQYSKLMNEQQTTTQKKEEIFNKYYLVSSSGLANTIVNVSFFAVFISMFFFFYAVRIEREVVRKQLSEIIANLTNTISSFESPQYVNLKTFLNNINMDNLKVGDEVVRKHNKKILVAAIITSAAIFIGVGIIVFLMYRNGVKFHFTEMITENIIILLIIAGTEILLLNAVVLNYKTLDQNKINSIIINQLIACKNY